MRRKRWILAAAMVFASGLESRADTNLDLMIPSGAAKSVDPAAPPPKAELFWGKNGPDWTVYWDAKLSTPRYLSPRTRVYLLPSSGGTAPDEATLAAAARAFVTANRDFFGAGGDDLLGPSVTSLDGGALLAFRQAAGGIPVRGASLRILLQPDGAIASIGAYLLREPAASPADLPDEEEARVRAEEQYGAKVYDLERQVVFPTTDPGSMTPAWSITAEFGDTDVLELFLDGRGDLIARRPLAMGFGVCPQVQRSFVANGTVDGFCPDPRDIYATAAGSNADDFYPLPDIIVHSHEGKSDLTEDDGSFSFYVSNRNGIVWPELTFGKCWVGPGGVNVIKNIFSVHRAKTNCDYKSEVVLYEEKSQDVQIGFSFRFNEVQQNDYAFELLAYHHVRKFHVESTSFIKDQGLHSEDYFPLEVLVPDLPGAESLDPKYWPIQNHSRICITRAKNAATWYPATIIEHEYGHHVVHTLVRSNQFLPMVDGLADALTAFLNDNHRIGFIAEDDPGNLGFSLEDDLPEAEMRARDLSAERLAIGKAFWNLDLLVQKEKGRVGVSKVLLYRWLASHRVDHMTDKTFEFSPVIIEELLDLDDRVGPHMFDGADGDRRNGTPHSAQIIAAFGAWPELAIRFIRGDANGTGDVDLSDAVSTLVYLFQGGPWPECQAAADADRSGAVDITDPIYLLNYLFLAGPAPEGPFPGCGMGEGERLWCKKSECP